MIELPEAVNLARQLNDTVHGKRISGVNTGHTPHKLAWYYGDKSKYVELLTGKTIGKAHAIGGLVEIQAEQSCILFGEGANVRFHDHQEPRPAKHQMLIEMSDGSAISIAVQMYGGMGSFPEGELNNPYYKVAQEKPSPLAAEFSNDYFERLMANPDIQKLSIKAVLATEQRIPGLGNGVLQDILFQSRIHPKRKANTLTKQDIRSLFNAIRNTLQAMAENGGRDTELDLFGRPGSYRTILSKNTTGKPCPVCGNTINKEAYLGGSIYYCPKCQPL